VVAIDSDHQSKVRQLLVKLANVFQEAANGMSIKQQFQWIRHYQVADRTIMSMRGMNASCQSPTVKLAIYYWLLQHDNLCGAGFLKKAFCRSRLN
jgi:hypothetical protein